MESAKAAQTDHKLTKNMLSWAKLHTVVASTIQGAITPNVKNAEMLLGGRRSSGRNVCTISGRGEYKSCSGCTVSGSEAGICRSKRCHSAEICSKDPSINDAFRGAESEGGKVTGGLFISFKFRKVSVNKSSHSSRSSHQFITDFSRGGSSQRDDAFFLRCWI